MEGILTIFIAATPFVTQQNSSLRLTVTAFSIFSNILIDQRFITIRSKTRKKKILAVWFGILTVC